ncbi:MAG: energy transducer TonB [Muribaculaceae bacterium]|nr:energy transducer TonB [Muribaculaceae bacterium]MBR5087108.1 energy transducer TonB [Muribaculaceae bacterium]
MKLQFIIILLLIFACFWGCTNSTAKQQNPSTKQQNADADNISLTSDRYYYKDTTFYDTIRIDSYIREIVEFEHTPRGITKGLIIGYLDNEGNNIDYQTRKKIDKKNLYKGFRFRILDNDTVFDDASQLPLFPGGQESLHNYIFKQIDVPGSMSSTKVIVQFVIMKDGSIKNVHIARGINDKLDEEAIRTVKSLPNFYPAHIQGEPVNCRIILPITFTPTK